MEGSAKGWNKLARNPKTPPSNRRLDYDPETTPKSTRLPAPDFVSPQRRKSFEDDPVMSLPDPRDHLSLRYIDIWQGSFLEGSQVAYADLISTLKMEFHDNPDAYRRIVRALKKRDQNGHSDLGLIIGEASMLFAGHPDAAHCLNHCVPPGFRLEAAEDYVAVFIPGGGWKQYPDGRREQHAVIPSSSR